MKEGEFISEFGSCHPVKFANMTATLRDSDGNEILCKCGEPASQAIISKEAYLARCYKCMDYEENHYTLVYRPPSEEQMKKYENLFLSTVGLDAVDPPAEKLPEPIWIDVHGREEHEALLRDSDKMHSLGLDPVFEKMVYLKRWGSWLNGCVGYTGEV